MQTVFDAGGQTLLFIVLLGIAALLSVGRRKGGAGFTTEVTNQLKGVAILAVIFGHLGYFLFSGGQFLFPLSTVSGVGVDLFFLLSGYGLAVSTMKKNYRPWEFYRRRFGKIFVPLWIVLVVILLLDAVFLGRFYDWSVLIASFLGVFPSADIYQDLNSPLWYLTVLLFYYLIFPWVYKPRWGLLSALIMGLAGYETLQLLSLPVTEGVWDLYRWHYLAFPMGVAIAAGMPYWRKFTGGILVPMRFKKIPVLLMKSAFFAILCVLFLIFSDRAVGGELSAQVMSLLSVIALILFFVFMKFRLRLLEVFGIYSYEIYLLHWPFLYRYDYIYGLVPAGWGTVLYLAIFLGLGYLLQKLAGILSGKFTGKDGRADSEANEAG